MKRKTKQKGDSPTRDRDVRDRPRRRPFIALLFFPFLRLDVAGGAAGVEDGGAHYALRLGWCHRILRALTVAIMVSFLLIIAMTTASTGVFVQVTAKALYLLILLSALASGATWWLRVRLERKMSQGGGASAEVLKGT